MANVKNINDILLGTGILYINNVAVGQLSGDVTFTYEKEYYAIEAGFPAQTIKKYLISEDAKISAGMLEVSLDYIGSGVMPEFTKETVSSGDVAVTNEAIEDVAAGSWSALENTDIKEAGVTVRVGSLLVASANAEQAVVYVEDASGFTAGDSVKLVASGHSETMTIDTDGVDTSANTLTFTTDLTNSYSIGDKAVNQTITLTEGTDYHMDRINGKITPIDGGDISDNDTIFIDYTYVAVSGVSLYAGGKASLGSGVPCRFEHTRADGKILKIEFYSAMVEGNFELPFHEDSETILEIEVTAQSDSTKAAGKQLFSMTLENAS